MGGASHRDRRRPPRVLLEAAHWEPAGDRPHRPPAQAAQRGGQALRARRRPGASPWSRWPGARRAAGRVRRRHVVGGPSTVDTRGPRRAIALPADRPARGRRRRLSTARRRWSSRCATVGCDVDAAGDALAVTPPSWRPDLTDPADLVEEVVRLAGYDDDPVACCRPRRPGRGLTADQRRRRSVGRALAEAGYVEAPAYPFVGDGRPRRARPARRRRPPPVVRAAQPAVGGGAGAAHDAAARPAGDAAAQPRPRQRDLALFEHGAVFPRRPAPPAAPRLPVDRRPDDEPLAALLAALPAQPWHVAVALTGDREPRGWWGPARPAGWADAVQAARIVAAAAGVELTVRAGDRAPWHPGRCAELLVGDTRRRARRRAAPAGVRRARPAGPHLRDGAGPRRAAGGGRAGRPRRGLRLPAGARTTSRWWSTPACRPPTSRRAARGRGRAAGVAAAVRRLHRCAGRRRARSRWPTRCPSARPTAR